MILVLNCGNQSVKWKLFSEEEGKLKVEKENCVAVADSGKFEKTLLSEVNKLRPYKDQIKKIGHRVVHGGDKFSKPEKITDTVLQDIEKLNHLAPLHNPHNVLGIKICQNIFRDSSANYLPIPQFAVFDTEFFANLPPRASTYALPDIVAKKFGIKKYGFQGISHESSARVACDFIEKESAEVPPKLFDRIKIITCHLGGGSSICAIEKGRAIDTSMGFTPLDGLVMMTRPGSIDPGVVLELAEKLSVEKAQELLNSDSGLKGICGEDNMIKILDNIKEKDKKAELALEVFVFAVKKYIGAYFAILGGCDLLVFTGAIGSASAKIRNLILKDLNFLSSSRILAVETDEELAIAEKLLNI